MLAIVATGGALFVLGAFGLWAAGRALSGSDGWGNDPARGRSLKDAHGWSHHSPYTMGRRPLRLDHRAGNTPTLTTQGDASSVTSVSKI